MKCCHHWEIPRSAEPVVKGVCRLCGATKQFDNVPPFYPTLQLEIGDIHYVKGKLAESKW